MNYSGHLALIGIGPPKTSIMHMTKGTGVLVAYKDQLHLVSCRHVIEPALAEDDLRVITTAGVADLGQPTPRYYAYDTDSETADFAVISLGEKTGPAPMFFPYNGRSSLPVLNQGTPVEIIGFPADAIQAGQPPIGTVVRVEGYAFSPTVMINPPGEKQVRVLHEHARIQTSRELYGMSGGLVSVIVGGQRMPYGIFSSDSVGRLNGIPMRLAHFVSFAHIFDD